MSNRSYGERKKAGRVMLSSWISKAAADRLLELAAEVGQSKTAMLEHVILTWRAPSSSSEDMPRGGGLLGATARRIASDEDELDSDEPIPEPVRRRRTRPRAEVVDVNAPPSLAERIRAKGNRRTATVLATGERAVEGRLRER